MPTPEPAVLPESLVVDNIYGRKLGTTNVDFESFKQRSRTRFLFPGSDHADGIAFTRQEILYFSQILRPIYQDLSESLFASVRSQWSEVEEGFSSFIRAGLLPLVHFFVDRFLRLNRFMVQEAYKDPRIRIVKPEKGFGTIHRIEDFTLLA